MGRKIGFIHSEETRIKISESNKNKVLSNKHRQKLSLSKTGKKRVKFSKEWRENIRQSRTGKRHTLKTRMKMHNDKVKHHIYLKENGDDILTIRRRIHNKLHMKAYAYIFEKHGKEGITDYLKWFEDRFGKITS